MPDTNSSLSQHLEPLCHALDPISLILSHNNSLSDQPVPLRLTTVDSFIMERGPRYKAYAELRETKLRMKQQQQQEEHEEYLEPKLATPPRKQVKFQATRLATGRKGSSSVLAQSVPDFSSALRKENRKPVVNTLPSILEMTPPSKSSFNKGNNINTNGVFSGSRGSKSESAGDKKKKGGGVLMARKSYASIDELRSLSSTTASAINGEGRGGGGGGRNNRVLGKSVSGHYRQF